MEKYSWIKQENTEQGEPGSYEHLLYGSLYMHTVWAILYSVNVGTHTKTSNIKNTTLRTKTEHRRKLEKSIFWMDRRNLGSELKSTTLSGRESQVFMRWCCVRIVSVCWCVVWVCLFVGVLVCQCDNSWTVWDIVMNFLAEQDMVKSSDEFENGSFRCAGQGRLMITTQAWKQTLPPSDRILYYTSASDWL